ncbi:MAG: cation diffusion facilitator family transporter [Candidatus Nanosyncoccus sp.]
MTALSELRKINKNDEREKIVVKTSVIGVVTNILLAVFKMVIGLLSNSIAIVLDAVNNISDVASSVITIVGTKLAGKEPDKKHPFGHGRIEYLSAMVIAVIILYAGTTSLIESVKQIIKPETPDYNFTSLIIIAVAVVVKIVLGFYVKKIGRKVKSDSLINSGADATMDAVISFSTLIAAIIFMSFGLALEAYLGTIISIIIIKSGIGMLKGTISQLLGEQNDVEMAKSIQKTVMSFKEVLGVYDLVLNNYGPNRWNGSVHIEVPDTISVVDLDQLLREIAIKVMKEHRVLLTAIGVYSVNTKDKEVIEKQKQVKEIALRQKYIRQIHGFYLIENEKKMRFDLVVSFDAENRMVAFKEAVAKIQKAFPSYRIYATMDADFTEE